MEFSMKESNELTLKVIGSLEDLKKNLEEKGYKQDKHFILDDIYMIPSDLELDKLSTREIISKAIIIRNVEDISNQEIEKKIVYKVKKINEKGEILEQKSIIMKIHDIREAEKFMESIGYKSIMNIIEDDYEYRKDGFSILTKDVKNGDALIEVETEVGNSKMDTIEKLKEFLESENLPLDFSNLFIKKAEVELNKILGRG